MWISCAVAALNNFPLSLIRVRLNWNLYFAVLIKINLREGNILIIKEWGLMMWKTSHLSRLWASAVRPRQQDEDPASGEREQTKALQLPRLCAIPRRRQSATVLTSFILSMERVGRESVKKYWFCAGLLLIIIIKGRLDQFLWYRVSFSV